MPAFLMFLSRGNLSLPERGITQARKHGTKAPSKVLHSWPATFCTWLPFDKIFKKAAFTMDYAVVNSLKMAPTHKCYMEVKYKKL